MEIILFLIAIAGFVFTIIIHDVSHGLMADYLGDPTAKLSGRLTLNPIPHIDIYGSILLPLFLVLVHSPFMFGWAKPVPFDPYNLKDPKRDSALIALAGPVSNIIIATALAIIYRFVPNQIASGIIIEIIEFNVALAVFNLIPIHPLDGGKILVGVLPYKEAQEFDNFMNRFGLILLFIFIFPLFNGVSLFSMYLYPVINFILNLLIPGFGTV